MKVFILFLLATGLLNLTAQNTFHKSWYLGINNSSGIITVNDHPGGGYMGIIDDLSTNQRLKMLRFNDDGDTIESRYFRPAPNTIAWSVDLALSTHQNSYYLLAGNNYPNYYGSPSFNSLIKTNLQGDSLWAINLTSAGEWSKAYINKVWATRDGGCMVSSGSYEQGLLMKISADGIKQWQCYATSGRTNWYSVCESNSGDFFAAGYYDVWRPTGQNGYKMGVMKVSASGELIWEKYFNAGVTDSGDSICSKAFDVLPLSDGGCLVVGHEAGPLYKSALLNRLTSSGELSWSKSYFTTTTSTHPHARILLPDNDKLLIGIITNTGFSSATLHVVKTDSLGNVEWIQKGYNYWMNLVGKGNNGELLFTGAYDRRGYFLKATSDGIYQTANLHSPINGSTGILKPAPLSWNTTQQNPPAFQIELSPNAQFNDAESTTVQHDDTFESNNHFKTSIPDLASSTTYYWRLRFIGYEQGYGPWSTPFSFSTAFYTNTNQLADKVPMAWITTDQLSGTNILHVNIEETASTQVQLISINGQLVWEQFYNQLYEGINRLRLEHSGLHLQGIYLCVINQAHKQTVMKIWVK